MLNSNELFDAQEIDVNGNSSIIQFEAVLDDNEWYKTNIYPYVYAGYPVAPSLKLTWRNTDIVGAPPIKAVYLRQNPSGLKLDANSGGIGNGYSAFVYNLPYYIAYDFIYMQANVVNTLISNYHYPGIPAEMRTIAEKQFKRITPGNYKFRIRYMLPGLNTVTSEKIITIPFSGI
jgi:hypothetical protein